MSVTSMIAKMNMDTPEHLIEGLLPAEGLSDALVHQLACGQDGFGGLLPWSGVGAAADVLRRGQFLELIV